MKNCIATTDDVQLNSMFEKNSLLAIVPIIADSILSSINSDEIRVIIIVGNVCDEATITLWYFIIFFIFLFKTFFVVHNSKATLSTPTFVCMKKK